MIVISLEEPFFTTKYKMARLLSHPCGLNSTCHYGNFAIMVFSYLFLARLPQLECKLQENRNRFIFITVTLLTRMVSEHSRCSVIISRINEGINGDFQLGEGGTSDEIP